MERKPSTGKEPDRKINELRPFVGDTPLFPLNNIGEGTGVRILAKLEWHQFGGSVKTRAAWNIVRKAIQKGELREGQQILDASSGNTAIAFAAIGAFTGIPVRIFMPGNASDERKKILRVYGATVDLTPATGEMDEAQDRAVETARSDPGLYYYADQYGNADNWEAHYFTTGPELVEQTKGAITHFVSGLGTTGTFMGTARRLKADIPGVHAISLQPDTALHALEGWKDMETVRNPSIYEPSLADRTEKVSSEEAFRMVRRLAREEGLLVSPSAGANLAGALKVAETVRAGTIVTLFPDNGEKYGEFMNQILKKK